MKGILLSVLLGVVLLPLYGCNSATQSQNHETTEQAISPKRPFITKWHSVEEELTYNIPIVGTYTLTWYNEATPEERHTEQVTVTTYTNADGVEEIRPFRLVTPAAGTYVVEAGPEGVEGLSMSFPSARLFTPDLLEVVQFGDVAWRQLSFAHCSNMQFASGIDTPDLRLVTSLAGAFEGCEKLNAPLEKWDVSHVTDMRGMFAGCEAFNQPLEGWNVSQVTHMSNMFRRCRSFNQPLERWDVSHVTDMSFLFTGCVLFNQPLGAWKTGAVTDMSHMFEMCQHFDQPLEQWDVSKVTKMNYLFQNCEAFNQPLAGWDVSQVEDMTCLFHNCRLFNQPLTTWNVGKVTKMGMMFAGCLAFEQSLETWAVGNVANMFNMFKDCPAAALPFVATWRTAGHSFE